jgi:predicted kinase
VVLVGLPGSGKSSWARRQGAAVLSSDDLRYLLIDDESNQTIHREVFATLRLLLRRRLELARPVTFIDATNITRKERRSYINTARLYNCDVEAVFFDVPPEICKSRNAMRERIVPDSVIDTMSARLVPPTVQEGFDAVTIYKWSACTETSYCHQSQTTESTPSR